MGGHLVQSASRGDHGCVDALGRFPVGVGRPHRVHLESVPTHITRTTVCRRRLLAILGRGLVSAMMTPGTQVPVAELLLVERLGAGLVFIPMNMRRSLVHVCPAPGTCICRDDFELKCPPRCRKTPHTGTRNPPPFPLVLFPARQDLWMGADVASTVTRNRKQGGASNYPAPARGRVFSSGTNQTNAGGRAPSGNRRSATEPRPATGCRAPRPVRLAQRHHRTGEEAAPPAHLQTALADTDEAGISTRAGSERLEEPNFLICPLLQRPSFAVPLGYRRPVAGAGRGRHRIRT